MDDEGQRNRLRKKVKNMKHDCKKEVMNVCLDHFIEKGQDKHQT